MDWSGTESKRIVEPFYLPHTKPPANREGKSRNFPADVSTQSRRDAKKVAQCVSPAAMQRRKECDFKVVTICDHLL
jgi:hypothetical protein